MPVGHLEFRSLGYVPAIVVRARVRARRKPCTAHVGRTYRLTCSNEGTSFVVSEVSALLIAHATEARAFTSHLASTEEVGHCLRTAVVVTFVQARSETRLANRLAAHLLRLGEKSSGEVVSRVAALLVMAAGALAVLVCRKHLA